MGNVAPAFVEPILRELLPGLRGNYEPTGYYNPRSWRWNLYVWDFNVGVRVREDGNVVEVSLTTTRMDALVDKKVRTAEEFRAVITEIKAYLLGVAAALVQACGAGVSAQPDVVGGCGGS